MKRDRLLESKIQIPRIMYSYVERESLFQFLADARTGEKAVVLNAGAGFGKTMLLSYYAAEAKGQKSAWYTLDELDNDLTTFMDYLTFSIQYVVPEFRFDARKYLSADRLAAVSAAFDFSVELVNVVKGNLTVILDDFQEITSEDVIAFLTGLLNNTGDRIRFMIATKGAFPEFLLRNVYDGSVRVLRSDKLAFSKEEVGKLVEKCPNAEDVPECAEVLERYTEGWPVGVTSVLLRMNQGRKKIGGEQIRIMCEESPLNDYLMYEVFRKLPYEIQDFLVKTSVLFLLSADICNAVLKIDNSKSILTYLVRENLFTIRLQDGEIYRYHSIFSNYLRGRISREQKIEICRNACLFSLGKDMNEQAVDYAFESGDFELAQLALERVGAWMIAHGRVTVLNRWLPDLETHQTEWNVSTTMLASGIYMLKGNRQKGEELLSLAEEKARIHGEQSERLGVLINKFVFLDRTGSPSSLSDVVCELRKLEVKRYSAMWYQIMLASMNEKLLMLHPEEALEDAREIWRAPISGLGKKQLAEVTRYRSYAALLIEIQSAPLKTSLESYENCPSGGKGKEDLQQSVVSGYYEWSCLKSLYDRGEYMELEQRLEQGIIENRRERIYDIYAGVLYACLKLREHNYAHAWPYLERAREYCSRNGLPFPDLREEDRERIARCEKLGGSEESRYLEVNCFGDFQVKEGQTDTVILWRTKKAKELVAFLFDKKGEEAGRDVIMEALWPDTEPGSAATLFYTTVSYVRKALAIAGYDDVILQKKRMYSMNMDLIRAPQLRLAEMTGADPSEELTVDLYKGSYMEDIQSGWVVGKREYYERLFLRNSRNQAQALMKEKRWEEAIRVLSQAVMTDGYAEHLAAMLISCYVEAGDLKSARRQFDRTKSLLLDELGVEPGEELRSAYQSIGKSASGKGAAISEKRK